MNLKDTKYDAFISYRHTELDKFVAENMHRKLEAFRLPSSIKKRKTIQKDRIKRVFRDRDELPLASNLADPITEALRNSDYLIVICTPRLPESQWCKKEIDTFINFHGRERIFAILAEGEPDDSFPPQLRYAEREEYNEMGEKVVVQVPVEPLAADIRGNSKREILKKMDEELLRLAAPMFDLNYDDLRQRHKEQKMKRILTLVSVIACIFLVFGIVSTVLSLKIQSQADEIFEQNQVITAKNEEITAQADQLQLQYTEMQKSYAVSMTLEAEELMNSASRLEAIYALRGAMPDSLSDTETPYVPQAQKALTDALQIYKSPLEYYPYANYEVGAAVEYFCLSPDGTLMLASNSDKKLTLFHTETKEELKVFDAPVYGLEDERDFAFVDNNTLLYSTEYNTLRYDVERDQIEVLLETSGEIIVNEALEQALVYTFAGVYCVDAAGTVLWEAPLEILDNSVYDYAFSPDGSRMFYIAFNDIQLMDTSNGSVLQRYEKTTAAKVAALGDSFYLYANDYDGESSKLTCYDCVTGDMRWSKEQGNIYLESLIPVASDSYSYLFGYHFYDFYTFDPSTGEIMEHEQTSSGIASAVQLNDSDIILFVQRDGTFQAYLPSIGIIMTMQDITRYHDIGYLTDMDMVDGNIFTSYHNISRVVHFSTALDITLEEQVSIELPREGTTYFNNSASACLIKDSNPANDYSRITLYSLESESVIAEYEFDTSLEAHFLGDETEFFSIQCFDFCNIYRIADGSLVKSFAREDGYTTNLTHDYITYTDEEDQVYIQSLHDLDVSFPLPHEEEDTSLFEISFSPTSEHYALLNEVTGALRIYEPGKDIYRAEIPAPRNSISAFRFSDNGKYLFVAHSDSRLEIYDSWDGTLRKTHYSTASELYGVQYIESNDTYFFYCDGGDLCMDSSFELIASIPMMESYDETNDRLICANSLTHFTAPFYSYDQLIQHADAVLGDFVPSERVCLEHNINQ